MDTKEDGQMLNIILIFEQGRVFDNRREIVESRGGKRKSREERVNEVVRNMKLEDSWRKEVCGTLPKKGCRKTEERSLKKGERDSTR